jgi:hypothetical protein
VPYFLTASDVYRVIQRELPPYAFPDGPASSFYHTAEVFSYGTVISTAYTNASGIYQNFFPQSCDANNISAWEVKVYGQINQNNLSLQARQNLVIAKLRTMFAISIAGIEAVINFTIPGLTFEVVCWCCGNGEGGWVLDVSQLDLETYLNYNAQFAQPVGANLCSQTPAQWGMTPQQWAEIQMMAYTYEVRIYSYTLTALQRIALNNALNTYEPARSNHVINDGLDPSQMLGDSPC